MNRVPRCALLAVLLLVPVARAADADALLPKDTELVYFFNVKQMAESDVMKANVVPNLKEVLKRDEIAAVLDKLGLDPLKDIDTVTIGTSGSAATQSLVAVFRGKFDAKKVYDGAADLTTKFAGKLSVVTEEELKLVKLDAGNGGMPFYLLVADDSTAIVGTAPKLIAAAVAAKKAKAKPVLGKELTALVARQDEKASFYLCQLTEGKLDKMTIPATIPGVDADAVKAGLGKMSSFSVSLRAGKELDIALTAGMKDADAAKAFGETVDKLLTTAKTLLPTLAGTAPQAKALVDDLTKTVKHEVKKGDVVVTAKLSAEAVGAMIGAVK